MPLLMREAEQVLPFSKMMMMGSFLPDMCCVVCVCFERKKEGKFKIGSTVLIIRYFFSCCTVSNVLAYGIEVKFLLGMNQIKE